MQSISKDRVTWPCRRCTCVSRAMLFCCLIGLIALQLTGCQSRDSNSAAKLDLAPLQIGIASHPEAADYDRGVLSELPMFDANSNELWQVDLRSYDISALKLNDRLSDLLHADFDSKTKWPGSLPEGFDKDRIMAMGKDPGLGIRELHRQGITGQGVSIAIIDQCLLTDHAEYKDRLKHYEEIHCMDKDGTMHGSAVASIAVGKTVGVAPGADLYYIAETHGTYDDSGGSWDFGYLARSIDRSLEINAVLPPAQRIRVISISVGWSPSQAGYRETVAAVNRAKKAGILVVSSSLPETYGGKLAFHGLGRDPYADPNDAASYRAGDWWASRFHQRKHTIPAEALLVPMDARCTASPTGTEDYVFYSQGGWSWSIPYLAGVYALACQAKPDVTPEEFWKCGLHTADRVTYSHGGTEYTLEHVLNPERLLAELVKK